MRIKSLLKNNKLPVGVALVYLLMFVTVPDKASAAMKNSLFYLIEMFEVLPVIFLLTVVIEALVPKEWIMKHFGEDSGIFGNVLSLTLGSISAGPIYAAFPISKMLLNKGASVANIVIILCSWAVIKVPMLANEAKFLGLPFMGIRWLLTVVAILLMGWVMGKWIDKKKWLGQIKTDSGEGLSVNHSYCVGCGICVKSFPEVYSLENKKAVVKQGGVTSQNRDALLASVEVCPVNAIELN